MIDSKGTPIIQFQRRILNCLPVDIPCLQKLPTSSVWTITGLTPSCQPPFKLVAIASPKYRDTATQNTTALTKEFNIQRLKSILQNQANATWASIPMPDTRRTSPPTSPAFQASHQGHHHKTITRRQSPPSPPRSWPASQTTNNPHPPPHNQHNPPSHRPPTEHHQTTGTTMTTIGSNPGHPTQPPWKKQDEHATTHPRNTTAAPFTPS